MHTDRAIFILGSGGHARVVVDTLKQIGTATIRVIDEDSEMHGRELLGIPVEAIPTEFIAATRIHVAIGDCKTRRRIMNEYRARNASFETIISPFARISTNARLSDGSFVAPGAIIAAGAIVGHCSIVNHNAVVDHDCTVGDACHISPAATLGGGCDIGHQVMIGAGANILPGTTIGDRATVGAGAVVTTNVPAGVTVVGMPAREIRHD